MSGDRNIDFVLRTVEKRDVRFIRLWFTDVLGNLKSFSISSEDLEEAFEEGVGFDGSSVAGFVSQDESDMLAFPDATTFQVLPWRPEKCGVARMFCDIRTPSRELFEGDTRSVLTRVFTAADEKGYVMNVGPKLEYFYFDQEKAPTPVPLDHAGYFDLTSSDSAMDLRRETTLSLEHMSIPVTYSYHSSAPSQNGIELRYSEAVTCADNIMTSRLVIRQLAHEHGMMASFMPKPFTGASGSGMFLYQSLFDHDGNNLFWAPKTEHPAHLSPLAQHYVAGLLKYAPEFMLVTNPTVNSYKRLVSNGEVPVYATWGRKNRSALVRIPTHKPGKHQATRVELRNPDPTANPYLALAVSLAAGIRGIEEGLELPEESFSGFERLNDGELASRGFRRLPRNLGDAIKRFDRSELMRETLGDHICDYLVAQKWREWDEYSATVTEWERKSYYAGL
ncbi:glutamine synthetase family protein [Olsenella phocaeensis]|uniref:glutamine synthetase family protein n=2 Tax=Olsenella phocaeensis TaxID=1852385 RepID=UPI0009300E03|nr:glutamine synthetase family protein [Olsenella phocaeensis]